MKESQIIFIGNSVTTIITYILMFSWYNKVYEKKNIGKVKKSLIYIITISGMLTVHLLKSPVLNLSYLIISALIVSELLYEDKLKKTILPDILYCTISTFCDMLTVIVMTILTPKHIEQTLNSTQNMIISNLLYCMIIYVFYKIYVYILSVKTQKPLRTNEVLFLPAMTVFEFIVLYCITCTQSDSIDGVIMMILITGFLLMNIYISYILNLIALQYDVKFEADAIKKQNQLQLVHYEELHRKYTQMQCIIHDIEKHIAAIEQLKHEGENEERQKYTQSLREEIKRYVPIFDCQNKILSVVLSQKIAEAESENISVKTDVEDLPLEFIDNADLTSILANLWDNAIEGCKRADSKNKIIIFKMCRIGGFIYIDMSNSFSGKLNYRNGMILSAKKDHNGLGLISIKSAIEKYGGFMISEHCKETFISEIVIPIH